MVVSGTPSPTLPRLAGQGVQRLYPLSREAGEGWGGGAADMSTTIAAPAIARTVARSADGMREAASVMRESAIAAGERAAYPISALNR